MSEYATSITQPDKLHEECGVLETQPDKLHEECGVFGTQPDELHEKCGVFGARPDKLHEECGVFGIWAPGDDVARLTFFGLQALQHRGQESAGIAVTNGQGIKCVKGCGLAREVFDDEIIASLQGIAAIGHVRYATSGQNADPLQLAHPFVEASPCGDIALAHNGTLTNPRTLLDLLAAKSSLVDTDNDSPVDTARNSHIDAEKASTLEPGDLVSDSQIAAKLIASSVDDEHDLQAAIEHFMQHATGAYSMVCLANDALFCMRDYSGIRPLCIGVLPDERGWVVASETCALDIAGAQYLRDVEPGEIVVFNEEGMRSTRLEKAEGLAARRASCIFEYVYFARPDSIIDSANVYRAREAMGRRLFHEAPVDADIVIGVPDSGIPAAIGYARESGVVYSEGIIKNRYVDRTFIQPTEELREQGIRIKLNPLHYAVRNRRIIVVDDSIVRGSTSKQLVDMLRDAGAAEVHMRITSPEIIWPCFLGINTDTQGQLIAAKKSIDEIRDYIGADSLAFLSIDGLKSCIYAEHPHYCTACFDGNYPMGCPDSLSEDAFLNGYTPTWEES